MWSHGQSTAETSSWWGGIQEGKAENGGNDGEKNKIEMYKEKIENKLESNTRPSGVVLKCLLTHKHS